MPRPLKYLEGDPITSMDDLARELHAGRYIIWKPDAHYRPGRRVHPGWAASWPVKLAAGYVRHRWLLFAIPNPEHPDNIRNTE